MVFQLSQLWSQLFYEVHWKSNKLILSMQDHEALQISIRKVSMNRGTKDQRMDQLRAWEEHSLLKLWASKVTIAPKSVYLRESQTTLSQKIKAPASLNM